jgi:hypothetical protein
VRKHTLQFACVKGRCLRSGGIARKDPERLGNEKKSGLRDAGACLAYAKCRQNGTTGGNVILHEDLESFSDAMDGIGRLKTKALGEFSIRRRAAGFGLIHKCLAETFFQHVTMLRAAPARRVTSVTASILSAHVHDERFRALRLYFKGGDERVFGVDDDMFGFALELQSDSELQGALLARFSLPRLDRYGS